MSLRKCGLLPRRCKIRESIVEPAEVSTVDGEN
jgi:hypothetical protein